MAKKIKGWPSKKELARVLPILEQAEGTVGLHPDASPLDVFRWELCQRILKFKFTQDLTQKQLAKILNIDEPQLSRILHHRIEHTSTDKLLKLLLKIEPNLKLRVS